MSAKYFVQVRDGKAWKRTNWTNTRNALWPQPGTSKAKAEACLKNARDQYPKEQYRIEVVATAPEPKE